MGTTLTGHFGEGVEVTSGGWLRQLDVSTEDFGKVDWLVYWNRCRAQRDNDLVQNIISQESNIQVLVSIICCSFDSSKQVRVL